MTALQLASTLTRLDHRLAIEHANLAAVRIKIVQARLSNRVLALSALMRTLFSGRISATSTLARPFGTGFTISMVVS